MLPIDQRNETVRPKKRSTGLLLVLAAPASLIVSLVLGGPHGGSMSMLAYLLAIVLVPIGGLTCIVELFRQDGRFKGWSWMGLVLALGLVFIALNATSPHVRRLIYFLLPG